MLIRFDPAKYSFFFFFVKNPIFFIIIYLSLPLTIFVWWNVCLWPTGYFFPHEAWKGSTRRTRLGLVIDFTALFFTLFFFYKMNVFFFYYHPTWPLCAPGYLNFSTRILQGSGPYLNDAIPPFSVCPFSLLSRPSLHYGRDFYFNEPSSAGIFPFPPPELIK